MKRKLLLLLICLIAVSLLVFSACNEVAGEKGDKGDTGEKGDAGENGITPQIKIGDDDYWYVSYDEGKTWVSLNVKATGGTEKGEKGDKGDKGDTGAKGESVTVLSVNKTNTEGSVDTYTIYFSDGSSTNFTVTNGIDGDTITIKSVNQISTEGLIDKYKITFSDNSFYTFSVKNGANGVSVTVTSIGKISSVGLIDTYEIVFSDGTRSTFSVTNGQDGNTPYIGENGNWWVGDEDTGVFGVYNYETRDITSGLIFSTMTVKGVTGLVVTSFNEDIWEESFVDGADCYCLNIPDYVG